jgi:hypothetical protein
LYTWTVTYTVVSSEVWLLIRAVPANHPTTPSCSTTDEYVIPDPLLGLALVAGTDDATVDGTVDRAVDGALERATAGPPAALSVVCLDQKTPQAKPTANTTATTSNFFNVTPPDP